MKISGSIVEITEAGDLITDIPAGDVSSGLDNPAVRVVVDDEHETFGIYRSPDGQPVLTLLAVLDDGQPLRLHLVGDSAAMMLGIRRGAAVEVHL